MGTRVGTHIDRTRARASGECKRGYTRGFTRPRKGSRAHAWVYAPTRGFTRDFVSLRQQDTHLFLFIIFIVMLMIIVISSSCMMMTIKKLVLRYCPLCLVVCGWETSTHEGRGDDDDDERVSSMGHTTLSNGDGSSTSRPLNAT